MTTEQLAERLYLAWCRAQNADPRPWRGPNALPDHRKVVWLGVAAVAEDELDPVQTPARVVALRQGGTGMRERDRA